MVLTDDQMTVTLDRLRREADQAEAVVNTKTLGFWHGLLSGDTGGGERTFIETVKQVTIPAMDRLRPRAATEEAKAKQWVDLAHYAEENLAQVQGYALEGTVDQILKDSIVKDVADVKQAAASVAPYAAFGSGVALVLVLGLLILLYAPHPR